ncbi:MAG TPA: riboflavin synthase [Candidatus Thermoplasmatota archaeon]|nr:riboflavin synthase [Candidatus Thermoplasmatota archaeon]
MRIAVVDTTFASVDMGGIVIRTLQASATGLRIERCTVPGIKDLGVACKRMLDAGCDIAVACGMPGPEPIDKQSAHVASIGLQHAMIATSKHIVEAFVHLDEAKDAKELEAVCANRCAEHALNALALLKGPTALTPKAGTGQRQGFADVGPSSQLNRKVDPFQAKGKGAGSDPLSPGSARGEAGAKLGGGGAGAGKH